MVTLSDRFSNVVTAQCPHYGGRNLTSIKRLVHGDENRNVVAKSHNVYNVSDSQKYGIILYCKKVRSVLRRVMSTKSSFS